MGVLMGLCNHLKTQTMLLITWGRYKNTHADCVGVLVHKSPTRFDHRTNNLRVMGAAVAVTMDKPINH